MRIYRGIPPQAERVDCALTIGNFDGVHRGHQALLARLVEGARERGLVPAVMTFEPHPRELFSPERAPTRISNMRNKLAGLSACGVERVFIQHFNRRFAAITPEQFISQVLVAGCHARWIMIGDDFRFGARRAGDIALLQRQARALGYEVAQLQTVIEDGERVSSSAVRAALHAGDLSRAAHLLGRPYSICGRVLHGAKLGRQLGFPTLNLRIAHRRPALQGIFAVRAHGLRSDVINGVASLGLRPTVDDSGRWLLEVHLFDFGEQVYGQLVQVEFVQKLREEAKYESLDQLRTAIHADAQQARLVFNVSG